MKTERSNRLHRYARSRVSRRSSGWFDWLVVDSFGNPITHPTLTTSGFEKSKCKAQALASRCAREYNETYVKPTERKVDPSECLPSCARREGV